MENKPITDAELAELDRLHSRRGECNKDATKWQQSIGFCYRYLRARLEAAERERDERTTMAARAQEALRYVMNGLPTTDAVWAAYGNADSARAWLAARDAQQRREGAAEWLEAAAEKRWTLSYTVMQAEAARLCEGGE